MFRARVVSGLPPWFAEAQIGDYFIQAVGSLRGGVIYIPDLRAVYRVATTGGWSSGLAVQDVRVRRTMDIARSLDWFALFLGEPFAAGVRSVRFRVLLGLICDHRVERRRKLLVIRGVSLSYLKTAVLYLLLLVPAVVLKQRNTLVSGFERIFPAIRGRFRS
jgi:hypothetical protein